VNTARLRYIRLGRLPVVAALPLFNDYFVVCRSVRHTASAVLRNPLIPRAAEMDCGLPWFTAVFPMFGVVRRTKILENDAGYSINEYGTAASLTTDLASAGSQ
jgi:hypothetical protein